MTRRKLIRQAGQALTVTMPVSWIRSNNLKAGDEVDVDAQEGAVVIRTHSQKAHLSGTFDFTGFGHDWLRLYLSALYAKGFDELVIKTTLPVDSAISQNMGFAVIEQRDRSVMIRDISGTTSEKLEDILKRVFQMLLAFFDRAILDILGSQKAEPDALKHADGEINKYTLFLQRAVVKHSQEDALMGKLLFSYADSLERIGDSIFRVWRLAVQHRLRPRGQMREIMMISKKCLEEAFSLMFQFNHEKTVRLRQTKEELRRRVSKLRALNGEEAMFLAHLVRISEESTDLTHLVLMLRLKSTD